MRRSSLPLLLVIAVSGCTCKPASPADAGLPQLRKLDTHVHINRGAVPAALELMNAHGIDAAFNLSGGWPGQGLEQALAEAQFARGRITVFANPPLDDMTDPLLAPHVLQELEQAKRLGARGLKIYKGLGLGARDPSGALVTVDDARLDPLFDAAGKLGLPIAIHTGDPVAFWRPPTADNERIDELSVHPGWSYWGKDVPSWEALFDAYERRVARHPGTIFIGVHFGNAPEYPERVGAMLSKYPNLRVDLAARIPELGRATPEATRALFIAHQDQILFGTDLGVSTDPSHLMLGSTGALPPTRSDVLRFFSSTWRYLETTDRGFEHPTPIQGRWTIDGIGLPREVLRKIYWDNASKLLEASATPRQ